MTEIPHFEEATYNPFESSYKDYDKVNEYLLVEKRHDNIREVLSDIRENGLTQERAYYLVNSWKGSQPIDISWDVLELDLGYKFYHDDCIYYTVRFHPNIYSMWKAEGEHRNKAWSAKHPCSWLDDPAWNPTIDIVDESYISSDEYYSTTLDNDT